MLGPSGSTIASPSGPPREVTAGEDVTLLVGQPYEVRARAERNVPGTGPQAPRCPCTFEWTVTDSAGRSSSELHEASDASDVFMLPALDRGMCVLVSVRVVAEDGAGQTQREFFTNRGQAACDRITP